MVRWWLRAEGFVGLVFGWLIWQAAGGEPIWFLILLITPDISMLGYLRGPRIGAVMYNVVHNWLIGGLFAIAGLMAASPLLGQVGALLVAHTGIDRLLGYGLKYPTSFQDTHLGRIGRDRKGTSQPSTRA